MEYLTNALSAAVKGDLRGMASVQLAAHHEICDAAAKLPPLIVSRSALAKVLESWRCGLFGNEEVQQWASFIRRGYVSCSTSAKIHPIRVEYDHGDEELIAGIVGRLDEIGDQIDGEIDAREQEAMLLALQA